MATRATLNVEFHAGPEFEDCINEMRRLHSLLGVFVKANFNGVTVNVIGTDEPIDDCISRINVAIRSQYNTDKFVTIN